MRYCWKCQSDQTLVGPINWNPSNNNAVLKQAPSSSKSTKLMSFGEFLKGKTSKKNLPNGPSNKKAKKEEEEVAINIGRKNLVDGKLKNVYGKRLPVTVPRSATYSMILEQAIKKNKAFDRNFNDEADHVLLYDDGSSAQFMPGGCRNFFELDDYKRELGKDFKRITLYLCPLNDHVKFEGLYEDEDMIAANFSNEYDDVIAFPCESVAAEGLIEEGNASTSADTADTASSTGNDAKGDTSFSEADKVFSEAQAGTASYKGDTAPSQAATAPIMAGTASMNFNTVEDVYCFLKSQVVEDEFFS